jgi:hypothetical protein
MLAAKLARVQPELPGGSDVTPLDLYAVLKEVFRVDGEDNALPMEHASHLLRHLYSELGRKIPDGEILVDKDGILSPIEGELSDEICRMAEHYTGHRPIAKDGNLTFVEFIRLVGIKPMCYIFPEGLPDMLRFILFKDPDYNAEEAAERMAAKMAALRCPREWGERDISPRKERIVDEEVLEAYNTLKGFFEKADVNQNALMDRQETADLMFEFAKSLNRHTAFVKATHMNHDGLLEQCDRGIERWHSRERCESRRLPSDDEPQAFCGLPSNNSP